MTETRGFKVEQSLRARALRTAQGELRAIYRLADVAYRPYSCPGTAECCQLSTTKREPWLWPVEWTLLLAAKQGVLPPARKDGGCPFLDADGKRCSVYAERPFGCRTYFCHRIRGPVREPIEAVASLSSRLARVAQTLDPETAAPRPLLEWARLAREGGAVSARRAGTSADGGGR
jgi:Fe-S-cluster containining protein